MASTTTSSSSGGGVSSSLKDTPLLLPFRPDTYNGVIVDPTEHGDTPFPSQPDAFASALDASLAAWRAEGKRGVWLKLPLPLAALVPVAAKRGFAYHHAEPDYLMMTTWLDATTPSTLPPGPSHQVGVGALVLDETGTRVLAVQEKSGPLRGTGVWKLPTGLLDAGEDLGQGAEREVMEETGIATKFRSLLAFRHAHRFAFGKSDLFFLARLDVVGDATPRPCPREIEACEWIPLAELTAQPRFRASPLYACVYDLCEAFAAGNGDGNGNAAEGDGRLRPIWGTRLPMGFRPGAALLYHTSEGHHRARHHHEGEGAGEKEEGAGR